MNEKKDKRPSYQKDKQKQDQRSITPSQEQKIITPRRISQFKHTNKEHIINIGNYEIIFKHKHGILGTLSVIQDKNTKQQYIAKTIKTNNNYDDKKQQLLSALREINDLIQLQQSQID